MPDCYALRVTEEDFRDFNHELGPFRFLLMDEQRFWAISCTEWYNLFAGDPAFLEFALDITQPGGPLVKMSEHYRSL